LHNEELRDLYSSPNIIRIIKSRRNAYRLSVGKPVGKPVGKGPLGRPSRWWVDNIRMDLGVVGWDNVDWIGLDLHRNRWRAIMYSVLNLRVP
jgi:hypothetical protein